MALQVGQIIEGKYRIVRLIGEGGMGAVYEGENVRISRRVAIKVLHAAFAEDEDVVRRFEREAQAAGRIGNDHILEVLDLGSFEDGDLFLVMEYLDGEPLSERVRRLGRMSAEQVIPVLMQVLEGLGAAHDAGIIHRDLKPDNIFVLHEKAGQQDFVKIIDFGISKFQPMSGDGMKMTKTGAMMGTPYYMSPEQATGNSEADARSDVYAIGVILYECITGQVPFDAPSFNQLLFKIALSDPPPIETVVPDLDPAFCTIVAKAMAREPERRFQSCAGFSRALREWMEHRQPVTVPPPPDPDTTAARALASDSVVHVQRYPAGAVTRADGVGAQAEPDLPTIPGATSRVPLLAAIAAIGIVVGGGVAFGAYRALAGGNEAETGGVADGDAGRGPAIPASESSPALSESQREAHADASPEGAGSEPVAEPRPSASEAPVAAKAVAVRRSRRAPVAKPKRPPAAAETSPPTPAPPTPPRPKSTTPDFGY